MTFKTLPLQTGSASPAGLLAPRPRRLIFNDFFVPVVSEGVAFGVAQVGTTDATGRFFCATHGGSATSVIGALDSAKVATYDQASHAKVGAIAVKGPGSNTFFSPKQPGTTGQDKSWGEPGVSARSFVVNNGTANKAFRVTIRWYRVVGVRDALYCEIDITPDKTSTDNDPQIGPGTAISISHMIEGKVDNGSSVMSYDAALDGLSIRTGGTNDTSPAWMFMRALSHASSGHHYEVAEQNDQYFTTGALPTGTDTITVAGTAGTPSYYRGHLAMQTSAKYGSHTVFRYVVGVGYSETEAKRRTANAPNITAQQARDVLASKVAARPALRTTSTTEQQAWDSLLHMLINNERTEQDWHPEQVAYDGTPRRVVWAGLGRWNAMWGYDSVYYMLLSGVDPQLVHDLLDYMLNLAMNQTTGYLRVDPKSAAQGSTTQHGALLYARALARHLAATGDTAFASTAYDKIKLLHNYWQTTPGYQHPNWPTVHLLTATGSTIEIGENTPITRVGGTGADTLFPDGDLKTSVYAYDLCLHMSSLATTLGKPAADVTFFNNEAAAYLASLRNNCWNSTLGWYVPIGRAYDTNGTDTMAKFNIVKSLHGFHALWMGVPTPAQAATMRAAIMDTAQFQGTYGLRTAPANWSGYLSNNWTLGGSRPYHTAAAISGLLRYGYTADAEALLKPWMTVLATRGTCPESNDPDLNQPGVSRFFGMTAALADALLTMRMPELQFGVGIGQVTS